MSNQNIEFYFLNKEINLSHAMLLTLGHDDIERSFLNINSFDDEVSYIEKAPHSYLTLSIHVINAIIEQKIRVSEITYCKSEYTARGKLKKQFNPYQIRLDSTCVVQKDYVKWLYEIGIKDKGHYNKYPINDIPSDFYRIPKDHPCVTPDTKALIETLLHFIENKPETHILKSGVKEKIETHIRENNTHKVGETAMKHYIPNILNWTHKQHI